MRIFYLGFCAVAAAAVKSKNLILFLLQLWPTRIHPPIPAVPAEPSRGGLATHLFPHVIRDHIL